MEQMIGSLFGKQLPLHGGDVLIDGFLHALELLQYVVALRILLGNVQALFIGFHLFRKVFQPAAIFAFALVNILREVLLDLPAVGTPILLRFAALLPLNFQIEYPVCRPFQVAPILTPLVRRWRPSFSPAR